MRLRSKVFFILVIAVIIPIILMIILSKTENEFFESLIESKIISSSRQEKTAPFREGERFLYKVKLGLFTAGSAELMFHGRGVLGGRDVYIITFEVKLANFYDKETIYTELDDFYPIRVKRDVRMFGRSIEITEDYDQNNKLVKIQRKQKDKTTIKVIQSDKKIQNIISLIYFYRNSEFKIGSAFTFNLPLKEVKMKVSSLEDIEVPKGKYRAHLLESIPKKYKFWLDTTKEKIPLMIDGAISFTGARMVLVETY